MDDDDAVVPVDGADDPAHEGQPLLEEGFEPARLVAAASPAQRAVEVKQAAVAGAGRGWRPPRHELYGFYLQRGARAARARRDAARTRPGKKKTRRYFAVGVIYGGLPSTI